VPIHKRHLADLFELDHATNDRLLAENDLLPGIGIHELVFGVPYFRIVNAAFCHAHPLGSRFNGPDRGAWYAAFELETARAEVAFHKWLELAEVGWLREELSYDDYLADVSAELHDIRAAEAFAACLVSNCAIPYQENGARSPRLRCRLGCIIWECRRKAIDATCARIGARHLDAQTERAARMSRAAVTASSDRGQLSGSKLTSVSRRTTSAHDPFRTSNAQE